MAPGPPGGPDPGECACRFAACLGLSRHAVGQVTARTNAPAELADYGAVGPAVDYGADFDMHMTGQVASASRSKRHVPKRRMDAQGNPAPRPTTDAPALRQAAERQKAAPPRRH